jgi:alkaline phosphatase D
MLPRGRALAEAGTEDSEPSPPQTIELPPTVVAMGDVEATEGIAWARGPIAGRMIVEVARNRRFGGALRFEGTFAGAQTDFTAHTRVRGLDPGTEYHYRVHFEAEDGSTSQPEGGTFVTGGGDRRVRVAFGGDTAGQGWGIDPSQGGMAIFDTIARSEPDVLVHLGDYIYADNIIRPEVQLDDGTTWRNVVTPEVAVVAETVDHYRGRYRYNLLDHNLRRLLSRCAMVQQWDDHEVTNNWVPGGTVVGGPYTERDMDALAMRARQAFTEYAPTAALTVYRKVSRGPHLDLFVLDTRGYRGPNSRGDQAEYGPASHWLGPTQVRWLRKALRASTATWKILCCDMPLGLASPDRNGWDNAVNGNGPAMGRELELADLLSGIKRDGVKNTAWITADLHYAAATRYDPARAQFKDFDPTWEFLAGPLHAGSFLTQASDDTFGPDQVYCSVAEGMKNNRPPSDGYQYFGLLDIDPKSGRLTVSIRDLRGSVRFQHSMEPAK